MTDRITSPQAETDKRSVARKVLQAVVERWHAGTVSPDAGRVLAENPDLARLKSIVVDLAYEEYCFRSDAGEVIDRTEFCTKFPDFRSSICRRLEVHDFFVTEPAFPVIGQRILGLQLIDELGRGALARVFLAEEVDVGNRLVAVKFSHEGQYEADFLGRLQHPNIVPIHSVKFDPATGLSAVVMPYLGDKTLADTVIKDVDETLRIFAQLTDALAYTHSQKILHRDLKPSNVLMGDRPMLMDFNLSADLTTESKRVGGTLQYMAPEQRAQVEGDAIEIDGRADIYSLGVMLNESLAGLPTSRRIQDIVNRCTTTRPEDRFDTAESLATALRRELRPVPRATRWSRRHPLRATAILVICLSVSVLAGVAYVTRPTPLERARQMMNDGRPKDAVDYLLSIEPKTADVLFALGRARLASRDPGAAYTTFADAYQMTNDGRIAACAGQASCLAALDPGISRLWHQRARDAGFDTPELQNNEAYCLRRQSKLPDAKVELEKALKTKPDLATAVHNLAIVNCQLAMSAGLPVPQDTFWAALDRGPESDTLFVNAALATIRSDMPEKQRIELTLVRLEQALRLGANAASIRSFSTFVDKERLEDLLRKKRNVKRVPPIFVSDPLGASFAEYPAKYD